MIGRSVPRAEDLPFLTGTATYAGDLAEGAAALVLVRSAQAAGRIVSLDTGAAAAMPGVLAVLTAADLRAAGVGPLPAPARVPPPAPGTAVHLPPCTVLAEDRVRHVGEPVAAVVAESRAAALAAAEAVTVGIEAAPAVADPETARAGPPIWADAPGNRVFLHETGDAAAVEAALAGAAHVVRARLAISRVTAAPMEPRAVLAEHDAGTGRFTLHVGTQAAHRIREGLAGALRVGDDAVRVVSTACGGSFGARNGAAPEYVVALAAARAVGRPVGWVESRAEAMLAAPHAREQVIDAALALDAEGRLLALRADIAAGIGAHVGASTLLSSVGNLPGLAGVYRIGAIFARVEGLHLNTQSMAAYRGAGRPEATYVIERMIDLAAARLGMDRVALRRRNLIAASDLPWRTPLGFTYDSGDFAGALDAALAGAGRDGFAARRAEAAARGRLRGLGLAAAIEIAGGPAQSPAPEFARAALSPAGAVLTLGTGDAGQGHVTTFRQVFADALGLPPERIAVISGDTDAVPRATGTFGSRSLGAAGAALAQASDALRARLAEEAAEMFEVAAGDIVWQDGAFAVAGTDRRIDVKALVERRGLTLAEERFVSADAPTYPNGCHVAEVEIDPETGAVTLVAYRAVEDLGRVVNPMLAEGQIHGGIAQGAGQALMEALRYDPETAQLLTGSFLDYAMPRAADLPTLGVTMAPTATRANPLGTKGAGEAGTVGALAAVSNAVADALSPLGIEHVPMPATPFAVWSAIRDARAATSSAGC